MTHRCTYPFSLLYIWEYPLGIINFGEVLKGHKSGRGEDVDYVSNKIK